MRVSFLSLVRTLPLLLVGAPLVAQVADRATPEQVGLSPARLARLDSVMQSYVDRQHVSGAVVLVARRGHVAHLQAYGMADVERRRPMRSNTIFRIASMSKAITSVAAMAAFEEGHFLLNQPIAKLLPEFDKPRVLVVASDEDSSVAPFSPVDAATPITFRHLLTHTSGITYRFLADFAGPEERGIKHLAALYRDANVSDGLTETEGTIGEMVSRLAAQPLLHEPGERFSYGLSTDVLGRVIEVASGMTFEEFLEERLFEPLGMSDTHFYLPPTKRDRLATVYSAGDDGLEPAPDPGHMVGQGAYVEGPRTSFSGGAGLLSTAADYARFLQMLLERGELGGSRILSPKTVDLMTVPHVRELPWIDGAGFGLGFSVTDDVGARGVPGSAGAFGWGGAYHSVYWVDPAEELIVVYLTQLIPAGDIDDQGKVRALVYQAIVDSPRP